MEKRGGNRTNIVVSAPVQKELMTGIEPVTSALPRRRSTT